jgi:hypothetical protein
MVMLKSFESEYAGFLALSWLSASSTVESPYADLFLACG